MCQITPLTRRTVSGNRYTAFFIQWMQKGYPLQLACCQLPVNEDKTFTADPNTDVLYWYNGIPHAVTMFETPKTGTCPLTGETVITNAEPASGWWEESDPIWGMSGEGTLETPFRLTLNGTSIAEEPHFVGCNYDTVWENTVQKSPTGEYFQIAMSILTDVFGYDTQNFTAI